MIVTLFQSFTITWKDINEDNVGVFQYQTEWTK